MKKRKDQYKQPDGCFCKTQKNLYFGQYRFPCIREGARQALNQPVEYADVTYIF